MSDTERTDRAATGLLAEIRERNQRWSDCPRHFFPHKPDGYRIGEKIRCANCGVEGELRMIGEYIRGYMAHGGDPADIMPDWKPRESVTGSVGIVEGLKA
jgi:hypothetical protein